jgi:hypothetical protein
MTSKHTFLGAMAIFTVLAAVPAKADTYTFNTNNCSTSCLPFTGTVSVTPDGANTVLISVTGTGFQFVDSSGGNAQFFFNVLNDPTITVTNLTAGWTLISQTASPTDALGGSGWGFDYALQCYDPVAKVGCGPGGSNPKNPPLSFDVSGTGVTVASFFDTDGGASPVQFAADVLANGNTGLVGATRTAISTTTPEPISLSLVGTGLISLFFLRRRARG